MIVDLAHHSLEVYHLWNWRCWFFFRFCFLLSRLSSLLFISTFTFYLFFDFGQIVYLIVFIVILWQGDLWCTLIRCFEIILVIVIVVFSVKFFQHGIVDIANKRWWESGRSFVFSWLWFFLVNDYDLIGNRVLCTKTYTHHIFNISYCHSCLFIHSELTECLAWYLISINHTGRCRWFYGVQSFFDLRLSCLWAEWIDILKLRMVGDRLGDPLKFEAW